MYIYIYIYIYIYVEGTPVLIIYCIRTQIAIY